MIVGLLEAFNLLPAAALRAMIEFRANPKFREEFQLTLTPESLHFRTATIDSTLKWTLYSEFFETDRAFILAYGKRMYTVIPKRALDNDSQSCEIRELLSCAIGMRKVAPNQVMNLTSDAPPTDAASSQAMPGVRPTVGG